MSACSSMKINSLPAKSGFCKNLTKTKSQQLFSSFSIVGTLNGLIWWNKKKFEYFHLIWDSRFLQADALNIFGYISFATSKNQALKSSVDDCHRSTRSSTGDFLHPNLCRTTLFRNSYFNRIVYLWNSLPSDIKSSSSVYILKVKLYEYYFNKLITVFDADRCRIWKTLCSNCRSLQINCCS
jgi:hypothetical protein